ncbi:MAG: PhoX family protein [Stanieria sp.]
MGIKRRHFLMFLGAGVGSIALKDMGQNKQQFFSSDQSGVAVAKNSLSNIFPPIKGPMPLEIYGLSAAEQKESFSTFEVVDDLVLPEGFTYQVIISWGDRIGESDHFGYNNDYVTLIETSPNQGYLVVNHEYVSAKPWRQGYQTVIGKSLPFDEVIKAMAAADGEIDAFSLPDGDPLKSKIYEIAKAAQYDAGLSIISVRQKSDGTWERTYGKSDRRITGISGLEDGKYLKVTGPAAAVFRKSSGQGYLDGLSDRIIGTHQNCAGGTTPWGTVFSAEENFQGEVAEAVYADGTSFPPSTVPFSWVTTAGEIEDLAGQGNVLGYQGNKYGWAVEVDPANPNDYGTKHSWLGRYRHEAFAFRAEAGKNLAVYSGCDRRGGHFYKFVSTDLVQDPTSKENSRLMAKGMLYAAKFNPDGTGSWIALQPDTPINPDLPSVHAGGMIPLPNRPDGGFTPVTDDSVAQAFAQQYQTLADLYQGNNEEELQGAILIDAHFAANAVGATCTARPEDADLNNEGILFIAFTSGSPSEKDGSPNQNIFQGPKGESTYEHGWIMKLAEDNQDPAAMTFQWELFATGGEPAEGGLGFSNPDNLLFDRQGNLWMVTDMSTDKHNQEIPSRVNADGTAVSQSDLRGLFGNNSVWYFPTSGANAGEAHLFAYGPMDCEICGPWLTEDEKTLFLAPQHPGESNGIRQGLKSETRSFAMKTTTGEDFLQTRQVPIGSNWPDKTVNTPPKPSVVAVRRLDSRKITEA